MQEQIIISLPLNEFKNVLIDCVNACLKYHEPIHDVTQNLSEEKFSRKQLANYLNVTLPTIDRYRANGVFPVYQTGRTIYFKKSEVDRALLVGNKKGAKK